MEVKETRMSAIQHSIAKVAVELIDDNDAFAEDDGEGNGKRMKELNHAVKTFVDRCS